jgi:hypothetical protein
MSLTKASYSLITGAPVNVLDYIPKAEHAAIQAGTSTYDAGANIQSAIDYCLSLSLRIINGQGTAGFPVKMALLVIPEGVYNTSQTLQINNGAYATLRIEGIGRACIRYTQTSGSCFIATPFDAGLAVMSNGPQLVNLCIWNDSETGGSVGLTVQRITNGLFQGLSFHKFTYAIQVLGGIDNTFDFQGQPIEYSTYGMLIQQETAAVGGPNKPNLTLIKDAYFIANTGGAITIRRNPGETLVNNGSGSVVTIQDTNFQCNSTSAAVTISYPGELPGQGTVNIERCWWEGAGPTGVSLSNGQCKISSCFYTNSTASDKPFLLQDNSGFFTITELDAVMGSLPVDGNMVQRADASVDGISRQMWGRNNRITNVSGSGTLRMGPSSLSPKDAIFANQHTNLSSVISSVYSSLSGTTANLAASGTETIFAINSNTGSKTYIVTARQSDGGQAWRGLWYVQGDSANAPLITQVYAQNLTLTASGTNVVMTNTSGSSQAMIWNAVSIGN